MGIAFAIDAAGRHMSPETAAELAALRAEVAALRAERQQTNEWVDDAAEALRADRDRVAELVALLPTEPLPKAMLSEGVARRAAWAVWERVAGVLGVVLPSHPVLFLSVEARDGEFHDALHHTYRTPHDLPELGGQR